MDASEMIQRFKNYFEDNCNDVLHENIRQGKMFIVIDFMNLLDFDLELGELVLEKPEDGIKTASLAVEEFDVNDTAKDFKVRFYNLPSSQDIQIRNVRSKKIKKLYTFTGIVRKKTDVRPQMVNGKWECPSCGNIISMLQIEKARREPTRCGCGRKGKFTIISQELIDLQSITLEEDPAMLEGGVQPKRMFVLMKNDLVSEFNDKRSNPGTKIRVVGYVVEVPMTLRSGATSNMFDYAIEANYFEPAEDSYDDIEITPKDEIELKELANKPDIFKRLVESIAPSTKGHNEIKQAIVLQLLGGVKKKRVDGVSLRGDTHVLLIGDPGAGKSQLLKRVNSIAPKSRYVSGKGASGAGLTASVVKDELLGGWGLEAGTLVLAHKGFAMIDELDKMDEEDSKAMHEALEQQTVSISKANIQATLMCQTTVLAAANPKFGRFDNFEKMAKQINLPSTLINRFDLIFPLRDLPNKEKDGELAEFIIDMHMSKTIREVPINDETLRKFIAYARQKVRPIITKEAKKSIKEFYVSMRNSGNENGKGPKAIPISARQLEGIIRLSEASAKTRLSDHVTVEDANRAINLTSYCLTQIGIDHKTGKIDIDRIVTGISTSERSNISKLNRIIHDLIPNIRDYAKVEDIIVEAVRQGIPDEDIKPFIDKLRKSGDIFFFKKDRIMRSNK
jgi:replicative DNA helicase Mcm